MRLLFLGDIFGRPGRQMLRDYLPKIVGQEEVDLVVANGENASGGIGTQPDAAEELFSYGVSVLTGGNHTFKFKDFDKMMEQDARLVRPANYPEPCPGRGWTVVETASGLKVGIGNLLGRVFINAALNCPFKTAEIILAAMKEAGAQITFIDFHAEATSEKKALAWHLDGKLGALVGTHTHVQTNDAQVLPAGTGFLTDVGMCGPHQSIIGMRQTEVLLSFTTGRNYRFEAAKKGVRLQGALIDFDDAGQCVSLKNIDVEGSF